jgi:hypothetical protein
MDISASTPSRDSDRAGSSRSTIVWTVAAVCPVVESGKAVEVDPGVAGEVVGVVCVVGDDVAGIGGVEGTGRLVQPPVETRATASPASRAPTKKGVCNRRTPLESE